MMPCGTKKIKPFTPKGNVTNFALPYGGFAGGVKKLDQMRHGSMKPTAKFRKPNRSGY